MATPTTITIPLQTWSVGFRQTAWTPISDTLTSVSFSIDRTAGSAPLNTMVGAEVIIAIDISFDGGTTFETIANAGIPGGIFTDKKTGTTFLASVLTDPLPTGIGRSARLSLNVEFHTVSLQGTATVS